MDQRLIFSLALTIFVGFQHEAGAAPSIRSPSRPPIRIVNGTSAKDGEFPYMVELRTSDGSFRCGGEIIAPEWILTAGHCVQKGDISSIVYGTNRLYDYGDGSPATSISVVSLYQHPKYYVTSVGMPLYDVGILKLATPIPLSATAQVIKLAKADATVPFHVQGVLSGWGVNTTDAYYPMPSLQKINLQLLTDDECMQRIYDYNGDDDFVPVHNICSDNHYNGGCFGDSGSPYVINGTQYGIVSWSYAPCGVAPGAYSRVSNPEYRNWITEVTNI